MGLIRYHEERAAASSLREHLRSKGCAVNERLSEAIDDWTRGRVVSKWERPTQVRPLWRLTLPLFMVYWLVLAVVILPLRWLVTGRYLIDDKSRLLNGFRSWGRRLFPNL